nr:MAG TPA: hypothetical protein [Caudoviricetes sp.]
MAALCAAHLRMGNARARPISCLIGSTLNRLGGAGGFSGLGE